MDDIENSLDPSLRTRFRAGASDVLADNAAVVLGNEVQKRTKNLDTKLGQVVSQYGQLANASATNYGAVEKTLPDLMSQVEITMRGNADIPANQMEQRIQAAKESVLRDTLGGMAARGGNALKDAPSVVEKFGYGILDAKEKTKLIEDLHADAYKWDSRELQSLQLKEKQNEKDFKQTEKVETSRIYVALSQAGNSDAARAPVLADLDQQVARGRITEEKARSLRNPETFIKEADDQYETMMMTRITTGKLSVDQAANMLNSDAGAVQSGVSFARAAQISRNLDNIRERQRQDPNWKALVNDSRGLITAIASPDILEPLNAIQKRAMQLQIKNAETQFDRSIFTNPKQDPRSLALGIIKSQLSYDFALDPKLGPGGKVLNFEEASPQAIMDKRKLNAANLMKAKAEGKSSPAMEQNAIKEDTRLKLRQKMLEMQQGVQSNPAPNDAARGK